MSINDDFITNAANTVSVCDGLTTNTSSYYINNTGNITPNTYGYNTAGTTWTTSTIGSVYQQPTEVDKILADVLEKIRGLSQDKLDAIGTVFKRSIKRYKALDKAHNIAREIGYYDDLIDLQELFWAELAPKVGYKNYNVRDGLWDAMSAQLVKNDLTQKEFIALTTPYGVTLISER